MLVGCCAGSVRGQATGSGVDTSEFRRVIAEGEEVVSRSCTAHGCRAVFHLAVLPKGEGGSTVEFSTRLELEFVKAAFTRLLMLFGIHTKVVLGVAAGCMCMVEGAVTAVENVDFREGEVGILMRILLAILRANKLSPVAVSDDQRREYSLNLHERSTMRRVLAVQYQKSVLT